MSHSCGMGCLPDNFSVGICLQRGGSGGLCEGLVGSVGCKGIGGFID